MNPSFYKKGFSLVEMILYVSILAVVSIAIIYMVVILTQTFFDFRTLRTISDSATVSLERMSREIRTASSIDISDSTFNAHPGRLSLISVDVTQATTTVVFYNSGASLFMQRGTSTAEALSAPSVNIENIIFRNITASSSQAVKVELSVSGGTSSTYSIKNFYNTAVLRGGY